MNEKEFLIWMKGFIKGSHEFNITPKQWEELKETVEKVNQQEKNSYEIDQTHWNVNVS